MPPSTAFCGPDLPRNHSPSSGTRYTTAIHPSGTSASISILPISLSPLLPLAQLTLPLAFAAAMRPGRAWSSGRYSDPSGRAALPPGPWIFHVNAPEMMAALARLDPRRLKGPRYGYWAWELPVAPPAWLRHAETIDEIWAPSAYTAEAFVGAPAPVRVVPLPVTLVMEAPLTPVVTSWKLVDEPPVTLLL